MIRNNLKVAYRTLYKEAVYSSINIAGLCIGIACAVILGLYLQSELTYDRHFSEHERIFRVSAELNANGSISSFAQTSYGLGPLLKAQTSDIEAMARLSIPGRAYSLFRNGEKAFRWDNTIIADANLFQVFSHDILYGDPVTALQEPDSIAVSARFAEQYFGTENPLGKIIEGDVSDYQVTLVFADQPDNTHLKYDAVLSYAGLPPALATPTLTQRLRHDLWYARTDYTYLLMPQNYDPAYFEQTSRTFYDTYMASYPDSFNSSVRFFLEPLADIHLYSETQRDRPRGSIFYIYAFIGLAVFVLGVACINYVNLSTARFSKRVREMAIRKVLGAGRHHLVGQLLAESLFFMAIAFILGLGLTDIVLNVTPVRTLLATPLTLAPLADPIAIGILILALCLIGLGAGLYPALHLSSTAAIGTLKIKNGRVRQALIFVQFFVSVCVISCAGLMYLQMKFIQEKGLGFEKENKILTVVTGADAIERIPVLINELKRNPDILQVSSSRSRIGAGTGFAQAEIENNAGRFETQSYNWLFIDENYIEAMGIRLVEGRNFEPDTSGDVDHAVLVNETLVRRMGWKNALGKAIAYEEGRTVYVIGVMADFHFQGLQHEVEPIVFWLSPPENFDGWSERTRSIQNRVLTISISGERIAETLEDIRNKWQAFDPAHPFEFQFMDAVLDTLYTSDRNQMKLVGLFAGLCILISCLGLYGLTAFSIEQRTREIGIRKVLGASSGRIIMLLFRNMLMVVASAAGLASAISYWIIGEWLEGFHYHGDINPLVFLIAVVLAIGVTFLTVSVQSHRTARARPVKALRHT